MYYPANVRNTLTEPKFKNHLPVHAYNISIPIKQGSPRRTNEPVGMVEIHSHYPPIHKSGLKGIYEVVKISTTDDSMFIFLGNLYDKINKSRVQN